MNKIINLGKFVFNGFDAYYPQKTGQLPSVCAAGVDNVMGVERNWWHPKAINIRISNTRPHQKGWRSIVYNYKSMGYVSSGKEHFALTGSQLSVLRRCRINQSKFYVEITDEAY